MKKILKRFLAVLVITLMFVSTVGQEVNATTISDNNADEDTSILTPEEIATEESALVQEEWNVDSTVVGEKYIFFGDSTTAGGYGGVVSYPYFFAESDQASISVYAIGGATMSGDDTTDMTFNGQLKAVKDLSSYDVAFLQFGINDYSKSRTIGDETSTDLNTVCGSLNAGLKKLKSAGVKVYCITPFPSKQGYEFKENLNGYNPNSYILAIKRVCQKNGVEVIDFNTKLCVTKDNFANYYMDSIHPGSELQKIAGYYLKEIINGKKENVSAGNKVAKNIYVASTDDTGITMGMVLESGYNKNDCSFEWEVSEDGKTYEQIQEWTKGNEWITWKPSAFKEYHVKGRAACETDGSYSEIDIKVSYHPHIKGKCQMPYEQGGFLIGVETYDNPGQSYRYEMLILDCTLLAKGKPAWTYSTGKCGVQSGNALWTVWQPKYGYYWTLFRVYDQDGNMIDEECYGFQNI